jgi:hypothetical protein
MAENRLLVVPGIGGGVAGCCWYPAGGPAPVPPGSWGVGVGSPASRSWAAILLLGLGFRVGSPGLAVVGCDSPPRPWGRGRERVFFFLIKKINRLDTKLKVRPDLVHTGGCLN